MLNLNQTTIPSSIPAFRTCTETALDIADHSPNAPHEAELGRQGELLAVLARIGCGQVILRRGRVVEACATARAILERECSTPAASPERLYGAVRQLMNRAGAKLPNASVSWLATSFKQGLTIVLNQITNARPDDTSTVILLDLDAHPEPNPVTLQNLFGFTAAETRLAIDLTQGKAPNDIARARQLSRTTIRSQLASLFVKTQTRRQAELVALLGRVTVLP